VHRYRDPGTCGTRTGQHDGLAWRDLRAPSSHCWPRRRRTSVLGIEPEAGNVCATHPRRPPALRSRRERAGGIILDPANLLSPATIGQQERILTDAVDLLGPHIVGVQAKDVVDDGYAAAGAGSMDYRLVLQLLDRSPRSGVVQDAWNTTRPVRTDILRWDASRRRPMTQTCHAGGPPRRNQRLSTTRSRSDHNPYSRAIVEHPDGRPVDRRRPPGDRPVFRPGGCRGRSTPELLLNQRAGRECLGCAEAAVNHPTS